MTKAPQLLEWILENNCEYFHVFFSFAGHVNRYDLYYYPGGWKRTDDYITIYGDFNYQLSELKRIKKELDSKYAPENIKETKRKEKLKKIEQMKKELEELEKEV